jgi:catechol 2,3-dioxygenase-like lactoylglutathione lyase family enzyme
MLTQSEAIFAVADVPQTIRFYCDVLGFSNEWLWGNPPDFGGVKFGKVSLMFCLQPKLTASIEGHQHFFRTEDIEGLYNQHKSAGAPITRDIENKPWGVREYIVRDLNGYNLRFAGPLKYERPKGARDSLPEYIHVERGTPSVEDYLRLIESVGWQRNEKTIPTVMERTLLWIMATDTRDGKTIGMMRACGDGRQYTIWDVMVLPDYQGQKIGTALLETGLAELRKIGPKGAFVGLFTGRQPFYERFGFVEGGGMCTTL